jgi:hypothetical protein
MGASLGTKKKKEKKEAFLLDQKLNGLIEKWSRKKSFGPKLTRLKWAENKNIKKLNRPKSTKQVGCFFLAHYKHANHMGFNRPYFSF